MLVFRFVIFNCIFAICFCNRYKFMVFFYIVQVFYKKLFIFLHKINI